MSTFLLSIGFWAIVIVVVEVTMWRLYCHKRTDQTLPVEGDLSLFQFCTPGHLRLCVVVHTVLLLLVVVSGHLLLW